MEISRAFGKALKKIRTSKNLTQEDFSDVSSRTYMSSLERGIKCPTLEKVDSLAGTMNCHPLTLLITTYLIASEGKSLKELLEEITNEIKLQNGND